MAIAPSLLAIASGLAQGTLADRERKKLEARQQAEADQADQAAAINRAGALARLLATPGILSHPADQPLPTPGPFDNVDPAGLVVPDLGPAGASPFARLNAIAQMAKNVATTAQSGRAVDLATTAVGGKPTTLAYDPAFSPAAIEASQARREREAKLTQQRDAFDYLHAAAPDLYPTFADGVDYLKARQKYAEDELAGRRSTARSLAVARVRGAGEARSTAGPKPKAPTASEINAYVETVDSREGKATPNQLASAAYTRWLNELPPSARGALSTGALYREFLARAQARLERENHGTDDPVQKLVQRRIKIREYMAQGMSEADATRKVDGGGQSAGAPPAAPPAAPPSGGSARAATPADRWEELVNAGMDKEAATRQVMQEFNIQ